MKNKRLLPIIGIIIGFVIGLFLEIGIWRLFNSYSGGIIHMSVRPSGGPNLGPGIVTVMTATLGGLIGVLVNDIRQDRKHR